MICPFCASDGSQVKDSRPAEEGAAIRRRRSCPDCGGRFTTFERAQLRVLTVLKRNGRQAPFDRDKLARSVHIALRKRPIDSDQIETIISDVVRNLEFRGETDVSTEQIGAEIMQALAHIDTVAYVRFASVYRNFREVEDFESFIAALRPKAPAAPPGAPGPSGWPSPEDDAK